MTPPPINPKTGTPKIHERTIESPFENIGLVDSEELNIKIQD